MWHVLVNGRDDDRRVAPHIDVEGGRVQLTRKLGARREAVPLKRHRHGAGAVLIKGQPKEHLPRGPVRGKRKAAPIVNVDAANDLNENGVCDDGETCDGTATDELTGLTWLLDANCFGERGWFQAMDDVNALAADGLSNCGLSDGSQAGDWRLPNVKEILSLIDY